MGVADWISHFEDQRGVKKKVWKCGRECSKGERERSDGGETLASNFSYGSDEQLMHLITHIPSGSVSVFMTMQCLVLRALKRKTDREECKPILISNF